MADLDFRDGLKIGNFENQGGAPRCCRNFEFNLTFLVKICGFGYFYY